MATFWKSQQSEGEYSLQFETDDKEKYKLVEKAAQMAIDGKTVADIEEVKYGKLKVVSEIGLTKEVQCRCGHTKELPFNHRVPRFCERCGVKIIGLED